MRSLPSASPSSSAATAASPALLAAPVSQSSSCSRHLPGADAAGGNASQVLQLTTIPAVLVGSMQSAFFGDVFIPDACFCVNSFSNPLHTKIQRCVSLKKNECEGNSYYEANSFPSFLLQVTPGGRRTRNWRRAGRTFLVWY